MLLGVTYQGGIKVNTCYCKTLGKSKMEMFVDSL